MTDQPRFGMRCHVCGSRWDQCNKVDATWAIVEHVCPTPVERTCGSSALVDHQGVECSLGEHHNGTHSGCLINGAPVQWGFTGPSVTR